VLRFDLKHVTRIVLVHRERRDQYRTVNADGIHRCHHLVTRHLVRTDQHAGPRPFRAVTFVAVDLRVDNLRVRSAGSARQSYRCQSHGGPLKKLAAMQHRLPLMPECEVICPTKLRDGLF
jgi:hypothetical protein